LFDPFEERHHMQTLLADIGFGFRRPVESIGDEDMVLTRFGVTGTRNKRST
jgi:hypothetical protein